MMNSQEFEKLLLDMVRSIYRVIRLVNPDVNHISMYSINGGASVTAFKDAEDKDSEQLFDIVMFEDGSMHLSDGYYKANGKLEFKHREVDSHDR